MLTGGVVWCIQLAQFYKREKSRERMPNNGLIAGSLHPPGHFREFLFPYHPYFLQAYRMTRLLVFLIAGWSGFFTMTVELLSGRYLAPTFGGSIHVWGGIIAVFMLALAAGYLAGGRLSINEPSLRKLALILLLAATTITPVILFGDRIVDMIASALPDPRYGSMTATTALFFAPTMFAGMVSPYAVRLLIDEHSLSGQCAGRLYFVSTFGSAAGTLITSFYLVLYLEIFQIIWALVGISATVALATTMYRMAQHEPTA